MHDFTPRIYRKLVTTLNEKGYRFQPFKNYIKNPAPRVIILRHDVDKRKKNSLDCAKLENELGILGTYYFRLVPDSFNAEVIKQIADLGHEIGYHYEDLAVVGGDYDLAIRSFEKNIAKLRRVVPIETICMHGSPLSTYDNRKLWEKYNYRDYGIIGEPYLDINFNEVLYLTDTGRRWDGESVNIRDKFARQKKQTNDVKYMHSLSSSPLPPLSPSLSYKFHSTFDIIKAVKNNRLPDKIMLTIHPQRWDDRILPWLRELVWQNVKNTGKWILNRIII